MKGKTRFHIVFFILFVVSLKDFSQVKVSGSLSDKAGNIIPGAIIKVTTTDSVFVTGAASDTSGNFTLSLKPNQKYLLKFSFLGYAGLFKTIETVNDEIALGKIILKEALQSLKEVEIKTTQLRGEQKGDTTQFNADSFKTNPDANAEDLIKKMPGVTSDNNGVKVNGETVQKVLVDGKPFFW